MDSRKSVEHRLAIIEGHLRAVRKMLAEGRLGVDVIRQSRAVQSALRKFDAAILEQYLESVVAKDVADGKTDRATKALVDLFGLL